MEVEWGEPERKVQLQLLQAGDPFLNDTDDLFVKTDTRSEPGQWYCVKVRDGTLFKVARDAIVRPIGAKVVVTRREES